MSELNTTPDPTPETDKATVTTDWMTGKPVVPADFARRLERERDKAREREKSLLLRLGQEKDHSEHVMARLNDSDTLRLAMFADLTTLRARVAELEAATALTPSHLLDELADLRRDREDLDWLEKHFHEVRRQDPGPTMDCEPVRFSVWTPEHGRTNRFTDLRSAVRAARAKDAKTEGAQ